MPRLRKPRALRRGSRIAIAAPAGPIDRELVECGASWLRDLDFEPVYRRDVTSRRGYLAGEDERRAAELMQWIADPGVEGVLCARGGYGCHRIVSSLDATAFRAAAKPLVGYSDLTTLLLWQRRVCGLMGFHGPMLERGDALEAASRESLARALRGEALAPLRGRRRVGGVAEGRLTGGSLSLVVASLASPWEIETRGAILLLEEVGEQPYRIDRMLQQLRQAGKLSGVVGIGIGALSECEGTRYPTPTASRVIDEILSPLGVPLVSGLPFGHSPQNRTWPLGARARLDGERGRLEILEAGVRP